MALLDLYALSCQQFYMNYRHAYHAGNFADVMKHSILALLLQRLCEKPAPFVIIDTHAGIGEYDLNSAEAKKTGEAERGIQKVLAMAETPAEIRPYLNVLRAVNGGATTGPIYPGSPLLTRHMLRADDRLIAVEKHVDDVETLKLLFRHDKQVAVHHGDGWLATKAYLPAAQKRALVLIDPPFEAPNEPDLMVKSAVTALQRMPNAILCLWHPIKERAFTWRLNQAIEDAKLPKCVSARLMIRADDDPLTLNGSGLIIVNCPWQFEDSLQPLLSWLTPVLAVSKDANYIIEPIS